MTTELKIRARAVVTVTLEIQVHDAWGGDCALSQVHKQALDAVRGTNLREEFSAGRVRVIGEPAVQTVIATTEKA